MEVFCSMIVSRSYNVLKEIYRNLCVLKLSKFVSPSFVSAKDNLISLCTSNETLDGELQRRYKFDHLVEANMDTMSECNTVFDFNESILNVPIYKSNLFYYDFNHIYESVLNCLGEEQRQDSTAKSTPNKFYNENILPDFMKQFSGILPLWTAITIPKGRHRKEFLKPDADPEATQQAVTEILDFNCWECEIKCYQVTPICNSVNV